MKRTLALIAFLVASAACFGPRPRIVHQELKPPGEKGGAWQLAVTVANEGPGEGAAEITSRLRDARGSVVAQEERQVELQPHETVTVTVELRPARPGPYRAASDVQSPPE
jgi:hypothetical protein